MIIDCCLPNLILRLSESDNPRFIIVSPGFMATLCLMVKLSASTKAKQQTRSPFSKQESAEIHGLAQKSKRSVPWFSYWYFPEMPESIPICHRHSLSVIYLLDRKAPADKQLSYGLDLPKNLSSS